MSLEPLSAAAWRIRDGGIPSNTGVVAARDDLVGAATESSAPAPLARHRNESAATPAGATTHVKAASCSHADSVARRDVLTNLRINLPELEVDPAAHSLANQTDPDEPNR